MEVYTRIIQIYHASNSEYILALFILLGLLAWNMQVIVSTPIIHITCIIQIICILQVLGQQTDYIPILLLCEHVVEIFVIMCI